MRCLVIPDSPGEIMSIDESETDPLLACLHIDVALCTHSCMITEDGAGFRDRAYYFEKKYINENPCLYVFGDEINNLRYL